MSNPRRVCFVTDELHPFTNGGIARLLHNLIQDARRRQVPVEFHVLAPRHTGMSQGKLDSYFGPGTRLHLVDLTQDASEDHPVTWDAGCYAPPAAFASRPWQAQSQQIAAELRALERDGLVFDEIEFPDFRGWALGSLQEKRLGRAFARSRVVVRLHSTQGILEHFEHTPRSFDALSAFEVERKALLEADLVVAHLPAVAAFNRAFHGFDEAWAAKVSVEFPPVTEGSEVRSARAAGQPSLVFASRTNPCKRPDLFIQAAAELMRHRPAYLGQAIIACHVFHPAYLAELLADVPADLRPRFQIMEQGGPQRAHLLSAGIVVVPSSYESLNLLAYEASEAGGTLILNERCLAFGDGTPFRDGESCFKFNGTVDGLVAAFERALDGPRPGAVQWRADLPYWEAKVVQAVPVQRSVAATATVVLVNRDRGRWLPETLDSVVASRHLGLEIVIVDDASTDPLDDALLKRLETGAEADAVGVKVLRNRVRRGPAASKNLGLRAATGAHILFVDVGDALSRDFLAEGVAALEADPGLWGVIPTVGYFEREEDLGERELCGYATFLGEASTAGGVASGSALHPLWRRSTLSDRGGLDETQGRDEIWSAFLNQTLRGGRFLATPEIAYFARLSSASEGLGLARRQALLDAGAAGDRNLPRRALELAALLLAAPVLAKPMRAHLGRPLRYELVDSANLALKRLGVVHRTLRGAVSKVPRTGKASGAAAPEGAARWVQGAPKPLRYDIVDNLNAAFKTLPGVHSALKRAAKVFRPG